MSSDDILFVHILGSTAIGKTSVLKCLKDHLQSHFSHLLLSVKNVTFESVSTVYSSSQPGNHIYIYLTGKTHFKTDFIMILQNDFHRFTNTSTVISVCFDISLSR